jgi:hypothetical protein
MALAPHPTPPPPDPAAADTQTLVDAGLLPEQPIPSADPPAPIDPNDVQTDVTT